MDEFDILHFHIDYMQFPLFRDHCSRTLTTLHGRQDLPDLAVAYSAFPEMPLVSISNDQRRPFPDLNWKRTIYHGLPASIYPFSPTAKGGYLAFLGRIRPEKRPDRAIEIARRAGIPLKIAAKVDRVDEAVGAVAKAARLDRSAIRVQFERRFSVERMANDYLGLYREMIGDRALSSAAASPMIAASAT